MVPALSFWPMVFFAASLLALGLYRLQRAAGEPIAG
jgi:hypothetical protein